MYQELNIEIYSLKWLRYTIFIPLYPLGVLSELSLVALALPYLFERNLWSISMPNAFNFAFSYPVYVIIYSSLYLPCITKPRSRFSNFFVFEVFPQLYLHMVVQRKKALGGGSKERKAE